MSDAKHSPAPWKYESVLDYPNHTAYVIVRDGCGQMIFDTGGVYRSDEQGKHDLWLVAAAPELLAAVQFALVAFCDPAAVDTDPAATKFKAMAEAALAKALGT